MFVSDCFNNCEYFTPADHRIYKEINVSLCAVGNIAEGLYYKKKKKST